MNNFLFLFIIVSVFSSLHGCAAKDIEILENRSAPIPQNIKPLPSDNGRVFVKDDGWQIPGFASAKKQDSYSRQVNADGGKKITVSITNYDPHAEETEEPFKSIGSSLGLIRVNALKEFAVGEQNFCYKVQANRIGSGSVFPFAYYDEDGDGKFETLVLDEKDDVEIEGKGKAQIISFFTMPHIPKWLQNIQ